MKKPVRAANEIAARPARGPPPLRMNRRAPARVWSADREHIAAAVCGIWLAAGSASFAGYMLTHTPQEPLVNGMQHLAIFGMPNGSAGWRTEPGVLTSAAGGDAKEIDFSTTGSISKESRRQSPTVEFPATGGPLSVIAGDHNVVWLRRGSAIMAAHVGDLVPGAGTIARIARGDQGWEPIGSDGAPLVDAATRPSPSPRESKKFSRALIFGDDQGN
jgi:hypothetical protein